MPEARNPDRDREKPWRPALYRLLEGNVRFRRNRSHAEAADRSRLAELARGQHPVAAVLGCSDARVSPELIFDQALGDIFVVRVAGNILSESVLGSLEFAVAKLQVPLLVVLGHSGCGAVGAATEGVPLGGRLPHLVGHLLPALEHVKDSPGDKQDNAARANARRVAAELRESEPYLAERVKAGALRVLPVFYELETGLVELLD